MKKTYAFYDVIGMKDALENNKEDSFIKFWQYCQTWTNTYSAACTIKDDPAGTQINPETYITTFSDSAILHTEPEINIDDFYKIALDLKNGLKEINIDAYCIINCDDEISHSDRPALGCHSEGRSGRRYNNAVGSGLSWINLYLADRAISKNKAWHPLYSLYCVGKQNIPSSYASKANIPIAHGAFNKPFEIHALK